CHYLSYAGQTSGTINSYQETLVGEMARYSQRVAINSRPVRFVYFGGGTPSLLTPEQVRFLFSGLQSCQPWTDVEEVTFECAPRSVRPELLKTLKQSGVTRLSMGVQSFSDGLLKLNGRIHETNDVFRAYDLIRKAKFKWVNIDLMVGLMGEMPAQWCEAVHQAIQLQPDSVTVYQTEIPHNTKIYRDMEAGAAAAPLTTWNVKRTRLYYAFRELERAGYTIVNGYMAVKNPKKHQFVYADHVWHGGDMIGLGVASFGYINGFHYQNKVTLEDYVLTLGRQQLPIKRSYFLSDVDRIVREFVLQLKFGVLSTRYFDEKFNADVLEMFSEPLAKLKKRGFLVITENELGPVVQLTRAGLLCVDRWLPEFYQAEFKDVRYA
ncbi:MAG: Coproporphyrinogen dehydrogenase, partial [Verrucomicrobiales bacterium]|nr:Coproporphyrinogen dehydrogenase [Verrucomicrobiales bacterium]